jgi:hypothetical protein
MKNIHKNAVSENGAYRYMSCHKEKLLRRASAGLAVIIASSAMVTGCGKAQESYTVYGGTNEESLVTDETFSSRFSTMEYAEEAEPESTPYGNTSETAAESGKTGETRKRKTIREDVSLVDNPEQRRVLIVVPEGSKVDVLKDKEDGWYKIRYRGTIGYVRSGYFVEDYEAEQEERRKREEARRLWEEEQRRPPQPHPTILGRDLIALGLAPCPAFRPILQAAFDHELEEPFADHDAALAWLRGYLADNYSHLLKK